MVDLLQVGSICVKPEILEDVKRHEGSGMSLENTTHWFSLKLLCVYSLIIFFLFPWYLSSAFKWNKE